MSKTITTVSVTVQHDISDAILGRYILDLLEGGHRVLIKDGRNE